MFKPQQCALLVSLACAGQAYAANVPEFAGDPVVVTATRQPQEISKTLSDVSVITREQIEQSAATSLPQLLSRQGGLEIVSTGARGAPSSIFHAWGQFQSDCRVGRRSAYCFGHNRRQRS
ncbi:hypothetical protein JOS77_14660 [Chromobacterium haemolyticum]|nr:hypothetical protein JOS77_14660 [Chromobacterium haemolyticum]